MMTRVLLTFLVGLVVSLGAFVSVVEPVLAKNWNVTSGDKKTKKPNKIDLSSYDEFRTLKFEIDGLSYDSYAAFIQGKNLFGFYAKGVMFYGDEICNFKSNITNRKTKSGSFGASCPSGLSFDGQYTYLGNKQGSYGSGTDTKGRSVSYVLGAAWSSSRWVIEQHYLNYGPKPMAAPAPANTASQPTSRLIGETANIFTSQPDHNVCLNVQVNADAQVEAKRRGLTCGVGETTQTASALKIKPKADPTPANTATTTQSNSLTSIAMTTGSIEPWMSSTSERFEDRIIRNWCAPPNETTLGGEPFLDPNSSTWNRCAVNKGPKPSPISYETVKRFYTKSENRKLLCRRVKKYKSYEETLSLLKSGTSKSALTYFILARDVELDCSEKEAVHSDVLSANAIEQLDSERQKRFKLEQQLAALKAQQEQQQTFSSDAKLPKITIASASSNGPQGTVKGRVTDNTGIAEVRVDGQLVQIDANGNFAARTYVPEGGVSVSIQAVDLAGLSSSMSVRLDRSPSTSTTSISFERLNPLGRKVAKNKDALALIIGVDGYKSTPARAIYADSDAKVFTDYASQKLGIPTNRIKTLVNDGAGEREMLLSVKSWLARASKQGKSDVYVFFAGHGLASDDGQKMYLLPYDGAPELLEKTAILRQELFDDIASASPRSVTVFLDTCYSGTTRGTDMLISSRPVVIKAVKKSVPDNFIVMTAAAGDQTAKPLEEAKHGMFSYFLMKGMEGEADENQDNKITAGELHQYVQSNVVQQSSGSQTPELQGDANRVLVQFQ